MAKQEKLTLAKKKAKDLEAAGSTKPEMVALPKPRTRIFAYRNYVGLFSGIDVEGLVNDPTQPGQMGFVLDAAAIDISAEAIAILKTIPKGRDAIGDWDIWELAAAAEGVKEGTKACFGWLGGAAKWYHPSQSKDVSGSKTWTTDLITKHCNVVDNDSILDPKFAAFIDAKNPCHVPEPQETKEKVPPIPKDVKSKPPGS